LNAEITEKIRLIAPRWFQATSSHEEKDDRTMDFVAATNVQGRLDLGGMERSLIVELDVAFESGSEIVADDESRQPAVRSLMDELITDFVIHVDGAEFLGKLEREKERLARGSDATPDGIIWVVEEELRKNRNGQT